jgi:hypothetical protein
MPDLPKHYAFSLRQNTRNFFKNLWGTGKHSESKPNQSRRYMVSPHDDVGNFFNNSLGTGMHRLSKGKLPVQPIFKDDAQREAFHKMAKAQLTPAHRLLARFHKPKSKTLAYLEKSSRGGAPSTRMNFEGLDNPTVMLQGHGDPGDMSIKSNVGEPKTYAAVGEMLVRMGLPSNSKLLVNSCWSGAGRPYRGNEANWRKRFYEGTLSEVYDPDGSFAANLYRYLLDYDFEGTVGGYLTATSQFALRTSLQEGGTAQHLGGQVPDKSINAFVRKRDVRVLFR